MVTRYPHTALITYEIGGKLVNGEWVDGETKTLSVKGRYDSVSDGRIVMKKNSLGDEKQVHGYFYTKSVLILMLNICVYKFLLLMLMWI